MKLNAFNVILTAAVLLKAESFRRVHGRLFMWEENIYINIIMTAPRESLARCPVAAVKTLHPCSILLHQIVEIDRIRYLKTFRH